MSTTEEEGARRNTQKFDTKLCAVLRSNKRAFIRTTLDEVLDVQCIARGEKFIEAILLVSSIARARAVTHIKVRISHQSRF